MKVSQVIISSAKSECGEAPSLVARSLKVDDALIDEILPWCPRRNELNYGRTQALSFFQLSTNMFALARSTAANFDQEREVLTQVVLLDAAQMEKFYNSGVLVAHYLRSQGIWMLPYGVKKGLQKLEIPDRANINLFETARAECDDIARVSQALEVHGKAALLGVSNPTRFLGEFLETVPFADRTKLSFSVGLKSKKERPFSLCLFESTDFELSKELSASQIRTLSFENAGSSS